MPTEQDLLDETDNDSPRPRAKKGGASAEDMAKLQERLANTRVIKKLAEAHASPIREFHQVVDIATAAAQDVAEGNLPPAISKEVRGWMDTIMTGLAADKAANRPVSDLKVQVNILNNLAEQVKQLESTQPKALPEPAPAIEPEGLKIRELIHTDSVNK